MLNFGESKEYTNNNITIIAPEFPIINETVELNCSEDYINFPYELSVTNVCEPEDCEECPECEDCDECPSSTETIELTYGAIGTCESGKIFRCKGYPEIDALLNPGKTKTYLNGHVTFSCSECDETNCPDCDSCCEECPECEDCDECASCDSNTIISKYVASLLVGNDSALYNPNCEVKLMLNGTNGTDTICPLPLSGYCNENEIYSSDVI